MFTLKFKTNSAAFDEMPASEIIRILDKVRDDIENGYVDGWVKDVNGNTIGSYETEF